ncbi:MMPL family protein, partial [Vibrio parahaemolyticus AQ3810]
ANQLRVTQVVMQLQRWNVLLQKFYHRAIPTNGQAWRTKKCLPVTKPFTHLRWR